MRNDLYSLDIANYTALISVVLSTIVICLMKRQKMTQHIIDAELELNDGEPVITFYNSTDTALTIQSCSVYWSRFRYLSPRKYVHQYCPAYSDAICTVEPYGEFSFVPPDKHSVACASILGWRLQPFITVSIAEYKEAIVLSA